MSALKRSDSGIDLHEMSNLPPCDLQAYCPPTSLWKLVEQHVHSHERDEVKSMLGAGLVDQSLELNEEVNTLLDIWRDFRAETQNSDTIQRFPEPPVIRERLRQEILFFVENLRETAQIQGRDPDAVLSKVHSEVIEYCTTPRPYSRSDSGISRPSTARSTIPDDGRETPLRATPTSDRFSDVSILSEELESMTEKLNVLKIDEVVQHLRTYLEDEVSQLMKDIEFLQSCLDDEAEYRSVSRCQSLKEPSISDLREERGRLEKELLSNRSPSHQSTVDKMILKRTSKPLSVPKLADISKDSRDDHSKKTSPMKASHNICVRVVDLPSVSNPRPLKSPDKTLPVNGGPKYLPTPPTQRNGVRPGSADRFRRMVLKSREF